MGYSFYYAILILNLTSYIFVLMNEIFAKFGKYLGLVKSDPLQVPPSFNLKVMHGINRLSIFMFLAAVIYLIIRFTFFR